eukprot:m.7457 g.7457  ORF g.7457 m.7457 type:complete len:353 (+) comp5253_c0_seq2:330-1388(+)
MGHCEGKTKSGADCRRTARAGERFCWQHVDQVCVPAAVRGRARRAVPAPAPKVVQGQSQVISIRRVSDIDTHNSKLYHTIVALVAPSMPEYNQLMDLAKRLPQVKFLVADISQRDTIDLYRRFKPVSLPQFYHLPLLRPFREVLDLQVYLEALPSLRRADNPLPVQDVAATDDVSDEDGMSLRLSLPSQAVVWEYRRDMDEYQRRLKGSLQEAINTDHVLEVQLMHSMYHEASRLEERTTRSRPTLRSLVNDVANLNNTTASINQAKKGPFTRFINDLSAGKAIVMTFDEYARDRPSSRRLVDDGSWHNIERTMAETNDKLRRQVQDQGQLKNLGCFLDMLDDSLNMLKLDA